MTLPLSSKIIALTGGASGIGLATAHLLASRGATLSLADINSSALETAATELREKYQGEVMVMVVDVRKEDEVEKWISETVKRFGKLDGAANLAGVIGKSIGLTPLTSQDASEWDFILSVNLTGVMHCLKHELRVLTDGGAIVNASSIAGVQGRPNNAAYAASKHGVLGLTRSAAKEVGGRGVRVNAVCPGQIETPMFALSASIAAANSSNSEQRTATSEAMSVALGRRGKAEEVASLIAFLLGDESRFITGASYSIDGGWNC
ncbi:3-oxoacyl-reductase [Clohesyomyces aquaticus]|uniref:3-oxoacyl-reductase n=1 Tax=Clohesyomyces aquaticus TaxID=1231657 RepID=A0A1Y1ZJH0_9PLEO|nr:3-oxoacyl-reductase [Clohesyomyces aquaticus]